jgi:molecular chaperone GrpE
MSKKFTDRIKFNKKPTQTKEVEEIPTTETERIIDKTEEKKENTKETKPQELTEIEKLTKEKDELKDRLLRTVAELQNTIKRNQDEIEKAFKFSISNFARDLINTMENLCTALDNIPGEEVEKNDKFKNFVDGVSLTYKELKKAFEKNHLKRIDPMGEKFDPNYHQAIVQIPSEKEEGVIVQVMQAGYMINDRVLRPALVGVAKKIEK